MTITKKKLENFNNNSYKYNVSKRRFLNQMKHCKYIFATKPGRLDNSFAGNMDDKSRMMNIMENINQEFNDYMDHKSKSHIPIQRILVSNDRGNKHFYSHVSQLNDHNCKKDQKDSLTSSRKTLKSFGAKGSCTIDSQSSLIMSHKRNKKKLMKPENLIRNIKYLSRSFSFNKRDNSFSKNLYYKDDHVSLRSNITLNMDNFSQSIYKSEPKTFINPPSDQSKNEMNISSSKKSKNTGICDIVKDGKSKLDDKGKKSSPSGTENSNNYHRLSNYFDFLEHDETVNTAKVKVNRALRLKARNQHNDQIDYKNKNNKATFRKTSMRTESSIEISFSDQLQKAMANKQLLEYGVRVGKLKEINYSEMENSGESQGQDVVYMSDVSELQKSVDIKSESGKKSKGLHKHFTKIDEEYITTTKVYDPELLDYEKPKVDVQIEKVSVIKKGKESSKPLPFHKIIMKKFEERFFTIKVNKKSSELKHADDVDLSISNVELFDQNYHTKWDIISKDSNSKRKELPLKRDSILSIDKNIFSKDLSLDKGKNDISEVKIDKSEESNLFEAADVFSTKDIKVQIANPENINDYHMDDEKILSSKLQAEVYKSLNPELILRGQSAEEKDKEIPKTEIIKETGELVYKNIETDDKIQNSEDKRYQRKSNNLDTTDPSLHNTNEPIKLVITEPTKEDNEATGINEKPFLNSHRLILKEAVQKSLGLRTEMKIINTEPRIQEEFMHENILQDKFTKVFDHKKQDDFIEDRDENLLQNQSTRRLNPNAPNTRSIEHIIEIDLRKSENVPRTNDNYDGRSSPDKSYELDDRYQSRRFNESDQYQSRGLQQDYYQSRGLQYDDYQSGGQHEDYYRSKGVHESDFSDKKGSVQDTLHGFDSSVKELLHNQKRNKFKGSFDDSFQNCRNVTFLYDPGFDGPTVKKSLSKKDSSVRSDQYLKQFSRSSEKPPRGKFSKFSEPSEMEIQTLNQLRENEEHIQMMKGYGKLNKLLDSNVKKSVQGLDDPRIYNQYENDDYYSREDIESDLRDKIKLNVSKDARVNITVLGENEYPNDRQMIFEKESSPFITQEQKEESFQYDKELYFETEMSDVILQNEKINQDIYKKDITKEIENQNIPMPPETSKVKDKKKEMNKKSKSSCLFNCFGSKPIDESPPISETLHSESIQSRNVPKMSLKPKWSQSDGFEHQSVQSRSVRSEQRSPFDNVEYRDQAVNEVTDNSKPSTKKSRQIVITHEFILGSENPHGQMPKSVQNSTAPINEKRFDDQKLIREPEVQSQRPVIGSDERQSRQIYNIQEDRKKSESKIRQNYDEQMTLKDKTKKDQSLSQPEINNIFSENVKDRNEEYSSIFFQTYSKEDISKKPHNEFYWTQRNTKKPKSENRDRINQQERGLKQSSRLPRQSIFVTQSEQNEMSSFVTELGQTIPNSSTVYYPIHNEQEINTRYFDKRPIPVQSVTEDKLFYGEKRKFGGSKNLPHDMYYNEDSKKKIRRVVKTPEDVVREEALYDSYITERYQTHKNITLFQSFDIEKVIEKRSYSADRLQLYGDQNDSVLIKNKFLKPYSNDFDFDSREDELSSGSQSKDRFKNNKTSCICLPYKSQKKKKKYNKILSSKSTEEIYFHEHGLPTPSKFDNYHLMPLENDQKEVYDPNRPQISGQYSIREDSFSEIEYEHIKMVNDDIIKDKSTRSGSLRQGKYSRSHSPINEDFVQQDYFSVAEDLKNSGSSSMKDSKSVDLETSIKNKRSSNKLMDSEQIKETSELLYAGNKMIDIPYKEKSITFKEKNQEIPTDRTSQTKSPSSQFKQTIVINSKDEENVIEISNDFVDPPPGGKENKSSGSLKGSSKTTINMEGGFMDSPGGGIKSSMKSDKEPANAAKGTGKGQGETGKAEGETGKVEVEAVKPEIKDIKLPTFTDTKDELDTILTNRIFFLIFDGLLYIMFIELVDLLLACYHVKYRPFIPCIIKNTDCENMHITDVMRNLSHNAEFKDDFINFCCNMCQKWIPRQRMTDHERYCTMTQKGLLMDAFSKREDYETKVRERPLASMPGTICYICGRYFTKYSIGIHENSCREKWRKWNEQLPQIQQKCIPVKPDFKKSAIKDRLNEEISRGNKYYKLADAVNELLYEESLKNGIDF